ncbi:hypothetical protein ACFPK1_00790 [Actinomycetospora rhizophila]|uniref:Uncharacterized protein n=1 Tax=Actinomycetospora rhizophila TaxID=1416876 RepID=A0ABV9ZBA2_9PSEU
MPTPELETAKMRDAVKQLLADDPILNLLGLHRRHVLEEPLTTPPPGDYYLLLDWEDQSLTTRDADVQALHVSLHRAVGEIEITVQDAVLDRVDTTLSQHQPSRTSMLQGIRPSERVLADGPSGWRTISATFEVEARRRWLAVAKDPATTG